MPAARLAGPFMVQRTIGPPATPDVFGIQPSGSIARSSIAASAR
jgi:hypothetical protein